MKFTSTKKISKKEDIRMKRFMLGIMVACVFMLSTAAFGLDVEFFETDVRSAFKDLEYQAREAGYDVTILVDDYVEGSITLSLQDVSADKVIETICMKGGYDYIKLRNGLFVIGPVDPDSPTFQKHAVTRNVRLDYTDSEDVVGLLSHYGDYMQAKGNVIVVRAWPTLAGEIVKDITMLDVPGKQIEVQLLASEVSEKSFREFGFGSLDVTWGDGLEKLGEIFSVSIGPFTFGATSQNDLRSALTLRVLSERSEAEITGSPKIRVLEGHEAFIKLGEERHIIPVLERGSGTGYYTTYVEKEEVAAETGLKVKVDRVTADNGIVLDLEMSLEEILESVQRTVTGEIIRVNKRSAGTSLILKNYETIPVGSMTVEREKRIGRFPPYTSSEKELVRLDLFMTANVVGTTPPPEYEGLKKFVEGLSWNVEPPKKKGFIKRHPILTLLIIGGIAWGVSSAQ